MWNHHANQFNGHCHLANVQTCDKFIPYQGYDLYRLDQVPATSVEEAGMFTKTKSEALRSFIFNA